MPLKILMVHPGASWSTADVHNALRFGFSAHGVQTSIYQLDVRIARSAHWLRWNWVRSGKQGDPPTPRDSQYHAASGILERACRLNPDWVFITSGMYLELDLVKFLRRAGCKIACLLTESPYDDSAQAEFIKHVDVAWTNERTSLARLREANPRTYYCAHGWHPGVHFPHAVGDDVPAHDVLFVGTGFPERIAMLREAQKAMGDDVDLSLYGSWQKLGPRNGLRTRVRGGVIDNPDSARLYQRARVNVNLMRRMKGYVVGDEATDVVGAESLNPRCFELAALGCFFVSEPRAELTEVFGDLVPTFETGAELAALVERWLPDEAGRRERGLALRQAVNPRHSWVTRAEQILGDLSAA